MCPLQVINRNPLDILNFLRSMTLQNGGFTGINHTTGTTVTVVVAPGKVKIQIHPGNLGYLVQLYQNVLKDIFIFTNTLVSGILKTF